MRSRVKIIDLVSYLPRILESLIDTVTGGIGDKVKNTNSVGLKKAEADVEKELSKLKHQQDLELLKYTQRHELQIKLLSLLDKIDKLDLSSPEQLMAFKQLMSITLALGSDNYVEVMTPTLRNITPNVQTQSLPASNPTIATSPFSLLASNPPIAASPSLPPANNLISYRTHLGWICTCQSQMGYRKK